MTPTFQGRRPGVPAQRTAEQRATLREHYTPTRGTQPRPLRHHLGRGKIHDQSSNLQPPWLSGALQLWSNGRGLDWARGPCPGPHEDGQIWSRHANRRHREHPRRRLVAASSPAKPSRIRPRNPCPRPSCLEDAPPAAAPRGGTAEAATSTPKDHREAATPPGNGRAAAPYAGAAPSPDPRQPAPPPPREGREGPAGAGARTRLAGDALGRRRGGGEERWGREELRRRELPGRSRERLRS
nr:uncharacterized protein LOC127328354 [Lolium perenne]